MKKYIFKPFVLLCLVFAVACNQYDLFREDPEYSELTEMQLTPVRDGVLLSSLTCGDVATFDEIESFWEEDHIVD